jgi:hypothetical protein
MNMTNRSSAKRNRASSRNLIFVIGLSLMLLAALAACGRATPAPPADYVSAQHVFPDLALAEAVNAVLPNLIGYDYGLKLGGQGSELWHDPGAPADEFWMLTDRGPLGQTGDLLFFMLPDFTPLLLHVRLTGQSVEILETLPLTGQSGRGVTGLPIVPGEIGYNPSGVDPEGMVHLSNGEFWICEEYGPSLLRVDATGRVLKRYLPKEFSLDNPDYAQASVLPALYRQRASNRGCESLALSPDEKTLYFVMERPLNNPDGDAGNASRHLRILAFDLAAEQPVAEYVYVLDDPATFDPEATDEPDEIRVSAAIALDSATLLIEEHTWNAAKVYAVDLSRATNLLNTPWDDARTQPSLEALADLGASGITAPPKTLVVNAGALDGAPNKIEGMALIDERTLAFSNDNDFAFVELDAQGDVIDNGNKTKIVVVRLARPLP